jgi:hypothetical protein
MGPSIRQPSFIGGTLFGLVERDRPLVRIGRSSRARVDQDSYLSSSLLHVTLRRFGVSRPRSSDFVKADHFPEGTESGSGLSADASPPPPSTA